MPETLIKKKCVGAIDIGASAIRLIIAELDLKEDMRYLEILSKPIRFGKEVFNTGRLSSDVMREGMLILKNFKEVADSYGVTEIKAVATSAVREAANRDNFIDQIFVRTGIDVEVLEGPEENRLELIAVNHALRDAVDLDKLNCLILEVGSGSTEMIILDHGKVEITRTLSLGALRLPEKADPGKTAPAVMQRVLRRNVREIAAYAAREFSIMKINTFIALGGDMRFVCDQLSEGPSGRFAVLEKKAFLSLLTKLSKLTPEEIVAQYGIPYVQAETIYPSLLVYSYFMGETAAEKLIVPMVSIRDGLLIEMNQFFSGKKRSDVSKQVLNAARHLAEKYKYDKAHSSCVTSNAIKLFDALKKDHGMHSKERLLLEVSGILHDIGTYVAPTAHHKHSSYLVDSAEIFGLRKAEKDIVSNVVRYHRKAIPRATHVPYMSLPKRDRAIVSKLSAILRVADALDHGHQQRIKEFTLTMDENAYTLWLPKELGDISLEKSSVKIKGDLFADVFGSPIVLRLGSPPKS